MLLYSNDQFPTKISEAYKETRKYGPFKGKGKPTESISEKELMADLLHKGS